jgi:hypothetical protein
MMATMPILANMGTPMMWLAECHLFILNAVIGLIEGLILWKWWKAPLKRALIVMIIANYASATIGFFAVWPLRDFLDQTVFHSDSIYAPLWVAGSMFAVVFISTVLIEWPLVAAALGDRKARRSFWASLVVNSASYALLTFLYLAVSQFSFYTDVAHDDSLAFVDRDRDWWVYYVGGSDGDLWRVRLDGSQKEHLKPLGLAHDRRSRSFMHESDLAAAPGDAGWDLWLRGELEPKRVLPGFASKAGSTTQPGDPVQFLAFMTSADLRPVGDRRWTVRAEFYGEQGIRINEPEPSNQELLRLSLATPWDSWPMRVPTITPSGLVVFQAGHYHIFVLDPERKTMGILAIGSSPVVAHD